MYKRQPPATPPTIPAPVPVASGAVAVILISVVLLLRVPLIPAAATTSVGCASLIWIVIVEAGCVWVEVSVVVGGGREACAPTRVKSAESVESARKEEGRMLDVACVRNVR